MHLHWRISASAALAALAGCGGHAGKPHGGAARAERPEPAQIVFLRRQYVAYALAPEVHVYADGSAEVITPSGGAGIKREDCRLTPALLAAVQRQVDRLPRRDLTTEGGSGDMFWVRAHGHTAVARESHVPRYMRRLVHQLAPLIDSGRCTTRQRFFLP